MEDNLQNQEQEIKDQNQITSGQTTEQEGITKMEDNNQKKLNKGNNLFLKRFLIKLLGVISGLFLGLADGIFIINNYNRAITDNCHTCFLVVFILIPLLMVLGLVLGVLMSGLITNRLWPKVNPKSYQTSFAVIGAILGVVLYFNISYIIGNIFGLYLHFFIVGGFILGILLAKILSRRN